MSRGNSMNSTVVFDSYRSSFFSWESSSYQTLLCLLKNQFSFININVRRRERIFRGTILHCFFTWKSVFNIFVKPLIYTVHTYDIWKKANRRRGRSISGKLREIGRGGQGPSAYPRFGDPDIQFKSSAMNFRVLIFNFSWIFFRLAVIFWNLLVSFYIFSRAVINSWAI